MTAPAELNESIEFVDVNRSAIKARLESAVECYVLYHADVDGLCAAASLIHYLGATYKARVTAAWVPTTDFHFSNLLTQFPPTRGRVYIAVDLNFSSRSGILGIIDHEYGSNFVIIDDHVLTDRIRPNATLLINPNVGSDQPRDLASSLFTYLLARDEGVIVPQWIPALGLYFDKHRDLSRYLFAQTLRWSEVEQVVHLLSATYLHEDLPRNRDTGLRLLLEAVTSLVPWSDFAAALTNNAELVARNKLDAAEIHSIVSAGLATYSAAGHIGEHPIWIYVFTAELLVCNIVASRLSTRLPCGVTVAVRKGKYISQFEVRINAEVRTVNILSLLHSVHKKVRLVNYGGHPRAAGGSIRTGDLQLFLHALHSF